MKNLLLLLISCSTIWSCSNQTPNNPISADTSATKDNLIGQTDTAKAQINANFPFGCADLKKFKYPKHWEGDLENYGHLKKPKGQEFESIGKCFNAINSGKTIKSPRPQKVELLEIGDIFKNANNLDALMRISFDSCRYRLPNIGIYECYYSYQGYGNLILLNLKTNEGKLLNIYGDDLLGDPHTKMRYFYIDKNEISIYEASYYDDGCSLDEKYKISINSDGVINISTLNK
ncbi:MAG: hypothetical protein WED33_10610 [Bacteroidia bacterium]